MLECFASVSCIDPTCISGEIDGFVFQFLQICTQKLTASNDIVNQDLGKAPVEPFTFQNQIQNTGTERITALGMASMKILIQNHVCMLNSFHVHIVWNFISWDNAPSVNAHFTIRPAKPHKGLLR